MRFTSWYVITGAPCSGKTTMINALARVGFSVVHEAARSFIDSELEKGRALSEIKKNELAFERTILEIKMRNESSLEPDQKVFLDRGIPDSIAYYRLNGLDPGEAIRASRKHHYRKVFLMDRFPFQEDQVRSEDEKEAVTLDRLIEESYRMFAYDIVRVPILPVKERVYFIIEHL